MLISWIGTVILFVSFIKHANRYRPEQNGASWRGEEEERLRWVVSRWTDWIVFALERQENRFLEVASRALLALLALLASVFGFVSC